MWEGPGSWRQEEEVVEVKLFGDLKARGRRPLRLVIYTELYCAPLHYTTLVFDFGFIKSRWRLGIGVASALWGAVAGDSPPVQG